MRETDVWRNATDAEFDNAMEGMEKLVMNRLYELFVFPIFHYRRRLTDSFYLLARLLHKLLGWFLRVLSLRMT
jgi:Domain of unknown function (DUF5601)